MERTYVPASMFPAGAFPGRSVLIDQAVRLLGVSKRTIYYWIHDGRLQTIRTRCGSQRVLVSSMRDLARQQGHSAGRSVPAETPDGLAF